ncbi:MAG: Ig-like domain-containing protein [Betaproteobacteria bacterium]
MGRLHVPALATLLLPPLLLAAPRPARAQADEYQARYGSTVAVSLDDLLQMPESYFNKAVRTRGQLDMLPSMSSQRYSLRGTFGGRVFLSPMAEAANEFEAQAPRWLGREVEVTGLFGGGTDPATGLRTLYIAVWGFLGPADEKAARGPVTDTTLEELVTKPGKLDGKLVRVKGQFRGSNLFGDLPSSSRKRDSDWVIKEELFAAWVTGRKPKGSGWVFDAGLKRDTGRWLQVTGRVATEKGVVTLDAAEVSLTREPGPAVQAAQPPPPPPPRPAKPPVVVFSLPLDGEREVPVNTVFQVQFSRDMEEHSFKGRVVLRYAGRPQPGDRDLDAVKVSYDLGLRTLKIDPGDLLRPGRVVEILLLPGIVDLDGVPLQTRPGLAPGGATDVLRFQTAPAGLLGGN